MEKFTSSPVGVPVNKGDSIIDVKHLNTTLVFYFNMCYTKLAKKKKENFLKPKGDLRMFRKKNAVIENFYDHAYKLLEDDRVNRVSKLNDAIKNYRIKEIKSHLFPEKVESYSEAQEELKQARLDVWTCKMEYKVALEKVREYYNKNHLHFVVCKDYVNPNSEFFDANNLIERIIAREF